MVEKEQNEIETRRQFLVKCGGTLCSLALAASVAPFIEACEVSKVIEGNVPDTLVVDVSSLDADGKALARFALLTGTRCSACHVNPQGGGQRTELGWSYLNQIGAFNPESVGIPKTPDDATNSYWDGIVSFGLDTRFEDARLGTPIDTAPSVPRYFIPMQFSPYISIT